MSREQLQSKIKDCIIRQASMNHQFDAIFKLYEAASMVPNNELVNTYREQLHNLLDLRLDLQYSVMELTRQFIRLEE